MSTHVYTSKSPMKDATIKSGDIPEISSNNTLAKLGYMVLATFDTKASHLFTIECNSTVSTVYGF